MGAEGGCEPHVVVDAILGVALVLCLLPIYAYSGRCSVGHFTFRDCHVAETYSAALPSYGKGDGCCGG